ncbi:MAG TPA: hypothetical protein DDW87_06900 [Firmicutes bacterium]|nr:hypothetical protein [Bacillota bacterium]
MKTRSLTEGAMLGAITVLLTILGEYIGIPSVIVPVPLMLLVYRQGFQYGILTAVVAALVSSLVAGHVFSGLTIIIWGFVGVAVGMALREKFTFPQLMLVGIASNIVVIGLNFLLYALIIGGNVFTEMLVMFSESMEQAMQTAQSLGATGEALKLYEDLQTFGPLILKWGLPAMLLLYAVSMSYINLAVVRLILRRMGDHSTPWIAPFTKWQLPPYFGLFLIFGMIITVLMQVTTLHPWLQFVGLNLFLLSFYAYLIAGVSLAWYYFQKKNVAMFLRVLLLFMLFTMQLLVLILIFLTVADGVFDFRRLKSPQAESLLEEQDEEN